MNKLSTIAAGSIASAALVLSPGVFNKSAHADDGSVTPSGNPDVTTVENTEGQSLALLTDEPEVRYASRKDAFLASKEQIVLHYGEGVKHVEILAKILRDDGYPATAIAGGKPGEVSLFVGHGIYGPYDQDFVYNGELGLHAAKLFEERVGPVLAQPVASLD